MTERPIIVFTDGAAKGNPGPGGWGVIIVTPDGQVTELGGGSGHTTNNQMELSGPIAALARLRATPGAIAVYTDSSYVIQGIRDWIWSWRRRGWKTAQGNPVLNRELWEKLADLVSARGKGSISWHYVRGHSGVPGNERVDTIADGYAVGEPPPLYNGPLSAYPVAVLELPGDTSVPQRSGNSGGLRSKKTAHSYLSVVDGRPMRHATWAECEQRVKGRSGARFKKAMSAAEEAEILRAWGFAAEDL
jgi:ribonuclease HI